MSNLNAKQLAERISKVCGDVSLPVEHVKDRLEAEYPGIIVTRTEIEEAWEEFGDGVIGTSIVERNFIISAADRMDMEAINIHSTGLGILDDLAGVLSDVWSLNEGDVIKTTSELIERLDTYRNLLIVNGYQDTREDQ
jgi:hypothetical protein